MRNTLTFLMIICSSMLSAQQTDSMQVLNFDVFYAFVLDNHPIVRQAKLLSDNAIQQLRLARGSFDPKIEGNWNQKNFKDQEYYNMANVGLKIPVWFPIDPKIGLMQNRGSYLNPEYYISDATQNRQVYMGVSVPIGRGLIIDERRAMVKQAKLFLQMTEAEQIKEINKILLSAAKDYWQWYFTYQSYRLIEQSIDIAQDIYDRTITGYELGVTAAIDTIQARIALQSRQIDFQQANIERVQAALQLSNHLWSTDGAPLELTDNMIPEDSGMESLGEDILAQLLEMAQQNHPELVKLNLKNQSLNIDRKLAVENLKPRLDVDYSLLDQPITPSGGSSDLAFTDNYKFGVSFAFPILLRKERAKLQQVNVKMEQNELEQVYQERRIINEIGAKYNEVVTTGQMLEQQEQMVNNYNLILEAERLNLQNGESDLFKINVQFDKLITSQTKLYKLRSQYQKSLASLYWVAGVTNLGYLTQ
ncbi:MAG: TolC family protein [Cyclobacteriaceae bacterium]